MVLVMACDIELAFNHSIKALKSYYSLSFNLFLQELGTPNEKIWPGFKQLPGAKNVSHSAVIVPSLSVLSIV